MPNYLTIGKWPTKKNIESLHLTRKVNLFLRLLLKKKHFTINYYVLKDFLKKLQLFKLWHFIFFILSFLFLLYFVVISRKFNKNCFSLFSANISFIYSHLKVFADVFIYIHYEENNYNLPDFNLTDENKNYML